MLVKQSGDAIQTRPENKSARFLISVRCFRDASARFRICKTAFFWWPEKKKERRLRATTSKRRSRHSEARNSTSISASARRDEQNKIARAYEFARI